MSKTLEAAPFRHLGELMEALDQLIVAGTQLFPDDGVGLAHLGVLELVESTDSTGRRAADIRIHLAANTSEHDQLVEQIRSRLNRLN